MRILHVIHRYHPARGGAELLLQRISRDLVKAGHEVQVITSDALDFELFWDQRRRRVSEAEEEHKGVAIRRFPVSHLPFSNLTFPLIRRLLWLFSSTGWVPLKTLQRLSRYAPWMPALEHWADSEERTFDLVAAMTITFDPIFAAANRLARRQGAPFVAYPLTHLGIGEQPGKDSISRFYTMRHQTELVIDSDALIALTEAEAKFYRDKGLAAEKIKVISPGLPPADVLGGDGDRFRKTRDVSGPIILSIGAMSAAKGTTHLVKAVQQLWAAGREVELVLIGEILSPFDKFVKDLPAADRQRIHLLGPVSDAEKADALAAATILALPSCTESFGIVYLEAWLYELPVIGVNSWAVRDVINAGEDGLLIPFGDVHSLRQSLTFLLDNPEKAREMGRKGKDKVMAKHTWSQQFQVIHDLYNSLV